MENMSREVDRLIDRSLGLARELCEVSDRGQAVSEDRGCSVLFGIIRDCAYSIMMRAEREKEKHGAGKLRKVLQEEEQR